MRTWMTVCRTTLNNTLDVVELYAKNRNDADNNITRATAAMAWMTTIQTYNLIYRIARALYAAINKM